MSTYIFQTNIKCSACESTVSQQFQKDGITNWEVDLSDPDRKLVVKDTALKAGDIMHSLESIGYQGILISEKD